MTFWSLWHLLCILYIIYGVISQVKILESKDSVSRYSNLFDKHDIKIEHSNSGRNPDKNDSKRKKQFWLQTPEATTAIDLEVYNEKKINTDPGLIAPYYRIFYSSSGPRIKQLENSQLVGNGGFIALGKNPYVSTSSSSLKHRGAVMSKERVTNFLWQSFLGSFALNGSLKANKDSDLKRTSDKSKLSFCFVDENGLVLPNAVESTAFSNGAITKEGTWAILSDIFSHNDVISFPPHYIQPYSANFEDDQEQTESELFNLLSDQFELADMLAEIEKDLMMLSFEENDENDEPMHWNNNTHNSEIQQSIIDAEDRLIDKENPIDYDDYDIDDSNSLENEFELTDDSEEKEIKQK